MTIDAKQLLFDKKGALVLDAKASYRGGKAMLTVYAYDNLLSAGRWDSTVRRTVMQRVFVPRETTKEERATVLLTMCDLVALRYDVPYRLRSSLRANTGPKPKENQP